MRPPPLPLGYCGHVFTDRRLLTTTPCSEQDSNLQRRGPQPRASCPWATGATHAMRAVDAGGTRTLITRVQTGGPTIGRQAHQCCGKGSNLHPRPSEGRAHPIELPQHGVFFHPASFRLHPSFQWSTQDSNLYWGASETPASSDWATGPDFSCCSHAPGRIRTCNPPLKRRRLCR